MRSKLIHEQAEQRTFVLVLETGEEVIRSLESFATENHITAAQLTAIGAFAGAVFGFFDVGRKEYRKTVMSQQVEVLSLVGNVATHQGKPRVHAHVVLGKADGTAHGGHLLEARVRPTLEVMIVESPGYLRRQTDEATGLALINPDA